MANTLNGLISLLPSLLRFGRGVIATGHRKAPEKMLVLFDGEYCPYCRYVREVLTELDLDAKVYPIPKGGQRFKNRLIKESGDKKIPFLIDGQKKIAGSQEIADYLHAEYGHAGSKPHPRLVYLSLQASLLRTGKGMNHKPSKSPRKPLELYSFEGSPFARLVRETLCELELPYVLRNSGRSVGSLAEWLPPALRSIVTQYTPLTENRKKLSELTGRVQIPYLIDPNTNTAMFESADIQRYLRETYAR